ncbi:MAG: cytochrome c [Gaiellaceae bacterium]|nr:cytochrome c [Gaiellaceae bacterium]
MTRSLVVLVALLLALGLAAAACGGGEEATPTPDTVTGELPTTETEPTETEPPAEEGDPASGKEIFLGSAGCGGCHTLADAGTSGTVGPNLDETKPSYAAVVDIVTNGRGQMPSFSSQLSEEDIRNVAAYVAQAAGG